MKLDKTEWVSVGLIANLLLLVAGVVSYTVVAGDRQSQIPPPPASERH
jgi:hypothetical protein